MGDGGQGARGEVIHVDPRFTRTSAMATKFIGIRAGTDIAFLGGVIRYILEHERWFDEYVKTLHERARDRRRGLPRHRGPRRPLLRLGPGDRASTTSTTWQYAGMQAQGVGPGSPPKGEQAGHGGARRRALARRAAGGGRDAAASALRLPDPQAPLRALHAGVRRRDVRLLASRSSSGTARRSATTPGRERTGAFAYAVGWTQHTVGVQYIRTAAIIQLLLGNIGRPGGGIVALRGHASIQGSTDIPTLYNIAARLHGRCRTSSDYGGPRVRTSTSTTAPGGLVGQARHVHRLAAEGVVGRGRDRGERLLLLATCRGSTTTTRTTGPCSRCSQGNVKGYIVAGENPAVGSANGKAQPARARRSSTGSSSATSSRSRRRRSGTTARRSSRAS